MAPMINTVLITHAFWLFAALNCGYWKMDAEAWSVLHNQLLCWSSVDQPFVYYHDCFLAMDDVHQLLSGFMRFSLQTSHLRNFFRLSTRRKKQSYTWFTNAWECAADSRSAAKIPLIEQANGYTEIQRTKAESTHWHQTAVGCKWTVQTTVTTPGMHKNMHVIACQPCACQTVQKGHHVYLDECNRETRPWYESDERGTTLEHAQCGDAAAEAYEQKHFGLNRSNSYLRPNSEQTCTTEDMCKVQMNRSTMPTRNYIVAGMENSFSKHGKFLPCSVFCQQLSCLLKKIAILATT